MEGKTYKHKQDLIGVVLEAGRLSETGIATPDSVQDAFDAYMERTELPVENVYPDHLVRIVKSYLVGSSDAELGISPGSWVMECEVEYDGEPPKLILMKA